MFILLATIFNCTFNSFINNIVRNPLLIRVYLINFAGDINLYIYIYIYIYIY